MIDLLHIGQPESGALPTNILD